MKKVLIYYPFERNDRLNYVASHLFNNTLGVNILTTHDKSEFLSYSGLAINYSKEDLAFGLWIYPNGLLEESEISPQENIKVIQWNGFPCFFAQEKGDIPFDLFAASFYLLSRYEEYTSSTADEHGRFMPEESLAYKNNFLDIPVVDRWAYLLKDELLRKYPGASFSPRRFQFVSTFDIDHPFLFRKKGVFRTIGGFGKDFLQLNFKKAINRLGVHLNLKDDPYMKAIRWITQFHQTAEKDYYMFILRGARGKYGISTILPLNDYFHFLKELKSVRLGLHPSYKTYKNLELLIQEKQELEGILERKVTDSRQHFLRMTIPETFQELSLAGIQDDFTLAYAKIPGFRSGTAIPHYFYDLEKEETNKLLLHPTIMMDTTLIFHQKLSPEEGLSKIKSLIDECYQSGGDYLSLWHNSNLAEGPANNPWVSVFVETFKYATTLEKNP